MADTLTVELNRGELYDVASAPHFETDGDFVLRLRNHGEPTHVHVRVDNALARVVRPEGVNHFVEAGGERDVLVRTASDRTEEVEGLLEIAVGHGATRTATEVTLLEPGATDVAVDESLAAPSEPDTGETVRESLRPAALGALGVLLIAGAVVASGPLSALFGVLALLAVGAALYGV